MAVASARRAMRYDTTAVRSDDPNDHPDALLLTVDLVDQ
jgi:hypothetical protein